MGKYADRERYPLGIDVSDYQGKLDASVLRGKVDWIAAKASEHCYAGHLPEDAVQLQFSNTVQVAYDIGVPLIAFSFCNPQFYGEGYGASSNIETCPWTDDMNVQSLIKAVTYRKGSFKVVHAMVIDAERWWIDYNEYLQYRRGERSKEQVRAISSIVNLLGTKQFFNNIDTAKRAGMLPDVPVYIYSAKWYIEGYTFWGGASLYDFISNMHVPVWECMPKIMPKSGPIEWNEVASLMPADTIKPTGLNGYPLLWQYNIDQLQLPLGLNTGYKTVDLDICMESKTTFYERLKFVPPTTPPPTTPPPTTPPPTTPPTTPPSGTELAAILTQAQEINAKLGALLDTANRHLK